MFSASPVSFEEAASLAPVVAGKPVYLDFFVKSNVVGCLIGCQPWQRNKCTVSQLEKSASNGCRCCCFLKALLEGFLETQKDLDPEELVFAWEGLSFSPCIYNQAKKQSMYFQLFAPLGINPVIRGLKSARLIRGDTSSDESFDRTLDWINHCEASHVECGSAQDVLMPTRCLDIEPRDSAEGLGIKLTETKGLYGTYACLSHCWGTGRMPIQTTTQTLNEHLNFIHWSSLPKTFQDAVVITRRLGLRYLWIDSLCIIQDSALDWQEESSKMADIYRDNFITLAAVSASGPNSGCFSPGKKQDLCIRVEGEGINTIVAARNCDMPPITASSESLGAMFPLFTRAWFFQERMLSRRILYCHPRELQFECRTGPDCECSCYLMGHVISSLTWSHGLSQTKKDYESLNMDWVDSKQVINHWHRTVMQYTLLRLTKPTDILPALSGCVKEIGRRRKDEYLAGLWRNTLADDLLWKVNSPTGLPRPAVWRAPSWSWASIDAPCGIYYPVVFGGRYKMAFRDRMEAAECVLAGVDTTGAVNSGSLRIRTALCPAFIRKTCSRCTSYGWRDAYTIELHGKMRVKGSQEASPCPRKLPDLDRWPLEPDFVKILTPSFTPDFECESYDDLDFQRVDYGCECKLASIWLLHMYDRWGVFQKTTGIEYFMALTKRGKGPADEFERIGLQTVFFWSYVERGCWFRKVFQPLLQEEKLITIV